MVEISDWASDTDNLEARSMTLRRIVNAPRQLAFIVWSQPEHIANWWGPDGFTTTTHSMDFRTGGRWINTMHGPDGTDYENENRYVEIVEPEKIIYEHVLPPHFFSIITFEDLGDKTAITVQNIFESAEIFEMVVNKHGAGDGLRQMLERYAAKFDEH